MMRLPESDGAFEVSSSYRSLMKSIVSRQSDSSNTSGSTVRTIASPANFVQQVGGVRADQYAEDQISIAAKAAAIA